MSRSSEMGWPFIHAHEMGQLAPAAIEKKAKNHTPFWPAHFDKASPNPAYKIFESLVAL